MSIKKLIVASLIAFTTFSCSDDSAVDPNTSGEEIIAEVDSVPATTEDEIVTTEDGDIVDTETGIITDKETGEVIDQDSSLIVEPEDETEETGTEGETIVNADYPDWTAATHEKLDEPNYGVVFPQDEVLRFDLTFTDADWEAMQTDIEEGINGRDYTPVWTPCSFTFNGTEWYSVGVRYKGNSSLSNAYDDGNNKLSLKLDFDEFEDEIPALNNQRFYGFKQLNLNNNYGDPSLMREKVGADLFREFGLVAAQTSYCVVYINNGSGDSQFYGVYTIVEEVDNTVLDNQLGDDSGNLYKPEGTGATFKGGSYDEEDMYKKTNEDEADYSDVYALYTTINSDTRTSDEETWKTELEAIFDVENFLRYLAVNNTIQNWDTYGRMNHNYYMYNNHNTGKLTWIPWDNNGAFKEGQKFDAISLEMSEVGEDWPIIRYIMDVEEYEAQYATYLEEFITDIFTEDKMIAKYEACNALVAEYAAMEEDGYSFIENNYDSEVSEMKSHAVSRIAEVTSYLE